METFLQVRASLGCHYSHRAPAQCSWLDTELLGPVFSKGTTSSDSQGYRLAKWTRSSV